MFPHHLVFIFVRQGVTLLLHALQHTPCTPHSPSSQTPSRGSHAAAAVSTIQHFPAMSVPTQRHHQPISRHTPSLPTFHPSSLRCTAPLTPLWFHPRATDARTHMRGRSLPTSLARHRSHDPDI